jgi:ABC-type transporter MlaC component
MPLDGDPPASVPNAVFYSADGHDNDTSWQIRDVYLAGTISELATRRSDFAATLRSGGIEALILRLNKKVDDLIG